MAHGHYEAGVAGCSVLGQFLDLAGLFVACKGLMVGSIDILVMELFPIFEPSAALRMDSRMGIRYGSLLCSSQLFYFYFYYVFMCFFF